MGDTGSLALGGALAGVAILSGAHLLLLLIGGVFAAETLSVIIQVASYKTTRRRVFRMSPLHHHFELGGMPETTVTARFWLASLAPLAAGLGPDFTHRMNASTSAASTATTTSSSSAWGAAGAPRSRCCARASPRSPRPTRRRPTRCATRWPSCARPACRSSRPTRWTRRWRAPPSPCSRPAFRSTARWCGGCRPPRVPVFSEVEVAYRICKAPIVAVTGTKGKTTTTALVGALFAAAGKHRPRRRQHRQRADPRDRRARRPRTG